METPLAVEPVEGWRAWRLSFDRLGPSLHPTGRGGPWQRASVTTAGCWRHRRHHAPTRDCSCGLYAVRDPDQLRHARSPAVIGTVALWGRVVEHTIGWRAEYGYPQRLTLVCHVCLFQVGPLSSRPDQVMVSRDGGLVPLCDQHLRVAEACFSHGYEIQSAGSVLRQLLDSYMVECLF